MGMQTDVLAGTLVESGFVYKSRTRVKGISLKGGASAGLLEIFSTTAAPVSATYARSGTTVTVTKVAHGLVTGNQIGLSFVTGTGGTATDGNYTVTRLTADTFTITDINSGSITAGAACKYGDRWIMTYRTVAGDTFLNYWILPGEGILAPNGVYMVITNLTAASIFYG
jgi:hypothetical protein